MAWEEVLNDPPRIHHLHHRSRRALRRCYVGGEEGEVSDWDYFRVFAIVVALGFIASAYGFARQERENKRLREAIEDLREVRK